MKKLGLILLAAAFSLQLFVVPASADKLTPGEKQQLKALTQLMAHTKDKDLKNQLKEQIKELKASFMA
jgi:hypothetical protein